jgi:hypothetical protein
VLVTHGNILLDGRPATADVPEAVFTAQLRNADGSTSRLTMRPLPTSKLPVARADTEDRDTIAYATLGVVRPLYEEYLVLGTPCSDPELPEQGAFADKREDVNNRLSFELLWGSPVVTFAVAMAATSRAGLIGAGVGVTIALSPDRRARPTPAISATCSSTRHEVEAIFSAAPIATANRMLG